MVEQTYTINGTTVPNGLHNSRKVPRRKIIVAVLILALLALGFAGYLYIRGHKVAKSIPSKAAQANSQLLAQYNANQTEQAQQKSAANQLSDTDQLIVLQKNLNNSSLSNDTQLQLYLKAAVLAAKLNDPNAKLYAQKVLELIPKDQTTQTYQAGLIATMTAISEGVYSGLPQ
jgi:uncharacterized protein HemX